MFIGIYTGSIYNYTIKVIWDTRLTEVYIVINMLIFKTSVLRLNSIRKLKIKIAYINIFID